MTQKTVLITGATGLLGSYLTKILLSNGYRVYALARGKLNVTPEQRVFSALRFWNPITINGNCHNLRVVNGDVTKESLGLNSNDIELIKKDVTEIFHCAASIQFNLPLEAISKINVEGTKNVLELGLFCKNLKKINHISTAYICGNHKGVFKEENLDVGQTFSTTYQQSKFEAEKLVMEYRKKGLWVDIFRPPFIVGESTTGKTTTFHAFYQTLYLWVSEIFDVFPGRGCYLNIIPVDILSQGISTIALSADSKNVIYHPFNSRAVSLNEIFDAAKEIFDFKTKIIPFKEFNFNDLTPAQKIILKNSISNLNENVFLDSTRTVGVLEKYGFIFPEIDKNMLLKLLRYAISSRLVKNIKVQ